MVEVHEGTGPRQSIKEPGCYFGARNTSCSAPRRGNRGFFNPLYLFAASEPYLEIAGPPFLSEREAFTSPFTFPFARRAGPLPF